MGLRNLKRWVIPVVAMIALLAVASPGHSGPHSGNNQPGNSYRSPGSHRRAYPYSNGGPGRYPASFGSYLGPGYYHSGCG